MIDPTELRIGNIVKSHFKGFGVIKALGRNECKVDSQDGFVHKLSYRYIEPVELSEVWMYKLGFTFEYNEEMGWHDFSFGIINFYLTTEDYLEGRLIPNTCLKGGRLGMKDHFYLFMIYKILFIASMVKIQS